MARNNLMEPAAAGAEFKALESHPPKEVFQKHFELRREPSVLLLSLLTVVLLTVSFPPFDQWYLAYVALAPWCLALVCGVHRRWAFLWAWLAGLFFWLGNLYWLSWITPIGYAAASIYLSAYWLAAAAVRSAYRRNLPMWIVLPIVWVAMEFLRAYVIGGFPWYYLAQSQYARTSLIQIADLTGQYGLSFFVAMVNGIIVDLLTYPLFIPSEGGGARMTRQIPAAAASAVVIWVALWSYGSWRLAQDKTQEGPVIGLVQHAFPITLQGRNEPADVIFKKHLKSTADFIGANCDLVIWPETMLPSGMNRQFLELDPAMLTDKGKDAQRQLQDQAANLADMSRRLQCPILAGGTTLHPNSDPTDRGNPLIVRNSTLWFDQADRPSRQYSKMRMVPFSEYVPFKQSWPALHRALRWFVPPVMEQLEPGAGPVRFDLLRGRNLWAIATPICFEGTFPDVCRKLVVAGGRKEADILANLSNDGWFVFNWGGGPYVGSTEHPMHLAHYCFRAVENRVPVVRAVNTGVSASIDSSGRIAATVGRGRVKAMAEGTLLLDGRIGEDGRLLPGHGPKVLVDGRVSLYSLTGDVFAWAVGLAFVVLAGWLTWKRIAQEKGKP